MLPALFLLKIALAPWDLLWFCMNLSIFFSISEKRHWNFCIDCYESECLFIY